VQKLRPEFVNWRRGAALAVVLYMVVVLALLVMSAWRFMWP
jgi:Tfp pilus assembly protein PilX